MFVFVENENRDEVVVDEIKISKTDSDGNNPCCHILTRKAEGICLKR